MNEQQKVQRYEPSGPGFGGVQQADDGDFVLYCDYDQLRKRLTEIEVECREAWKQAAYWRPRAEQAEAKLALAEQDAVRWQWFRENGDSWHGPNAPAFCYFEIGIAPEQLDQAIDAAIASQGEK